MKKLLWLLILMTPVALAAQTPVPAGPVSGIWDLSGSPYIVNGEIYIDADEMLVIEAGVEVKFTGWFKFIVNGALMAQGTETDNILFTANDTNNRWHGIHFQQTNKTSVLDHCIVEYGLSSYSGSTPTPDNSGGGITCWLSPAASITVKNSIIRNNEASIGGGLQVNGSSLLVENCEITMNEAEWGGAIDAMNLYGSSEIATIRNCLIENNSATSSGGGISAGIYCSLYLSGNTITHNISPSGAGIRVYQPDTVVANNNLIAHNQALNQGGGIGCWYIQSDASFIDNTVVFNSAPNGGGIFLQNASSPLFESSIVYFNTQQVYLNNSSCDPIFNYCDVQGGAEGFVGPGIINYDTTLYTNCICENPLFVDYQNDDFNLSWLNYPIEDETKSPCIDAGLGMSLLGINGKNDIGVMEYVYVIDSPVLSVHQISGNGFLAEWTQCYGAIAYYLDIALDEEFNNMVYDSIDTGSDTCYLVEGLTPNTLYYCRVFSYNSGVRKKSNVVPVQIVRTVELEQSAFQVYAAHKMLIIDLDQNTMESAKCNIYDISGRLIKSRTIFPGSNIIALDIPNQIVIISVVRKGRANQQKLLIH